MKTVKINRDDLLEVLINNREKHNRNVSELKADRQAAIIEWMESSIKEFATYTKEPELKDFPKIGDNSSAYDRAIRMMEMSVDKEIELSESEFDQYVMDNWSFNHDLLRTATFYGKQLA